MNQILQLQEERRKKNNTQLDTNQIVLFFAVAIIIFGLIFVGEGAYAIYQEKQNQKVQPSTPDGGSSIPEPEYIAPTITLTQIEDNKLAIKVESQDAISHIIYNWNNGGSETLDETGKTSLEEIIDIPVGENTINISVIDSNGIETKKQETYVIEQSKPVIELAVVGNDIKITVTSEVELSYVTYKWNLEEEQKDTMITFEDRKKYEKQIEIPKGQNTLRIVAVDINGNEDVKSQEIKGVAKLKNPKVEVTGEYIYFVFEAEDNMKTVEYTFNGVTRIMNTETFGQTKIVRFRLKVQEGWNYLKLIGTTQTDAKNESLWKYEYKPQ